MANNPDPPGRIVVVDDDATVADVVGRYLVRDGHTVECVHDGYEALRRIADQPPDLVVLDLMLPGIDGLEVCRRLRERWPIPVVMLTALGDETDRLAGFEIGADDYVTKPFSPRELVARVRSLLRRTSHEVAHPNEGTLPSRTRVGDLEIDHTFHEVRVGGNPVNVTATEFKILTILAENPGEVFTRSGLLDRLHDVGEIYERTLDRHINNLRKKIEKDLHNPEYVVTVYGVGYKMNKPSGRSQPWPHLSSS